MKYLFIKYFVAISLIIINYVQQSKSQSLTRHTYQDFKIAYASLFSICQKYKYNCKKNGCEQQIKQEIIIRPNQNRQQFKIIVQHPNEGIIRVFVQYRRLQIHQYSESDVVIYCKECKFSPEISFDFEQFYINQYQQLTNLIEQIKKEYPSVNSIYVSGINQGSAMALLIGAQLKIQFQQLIVGVYAFNELPGMYDQNYMNYVEDHISLSFYYRVMNGSLEYVKKLNGNVYPSSKLAKQILIINRKFYPREQQTFEQIASRIKKEKNQVRLPYYRDCNRN